MHGLAGDPGHHAEVAVVVQQGQVRRRMMQTPVVRFVHRKTGSNAGELPPLRASAKAVWAVPREGQLGDPGGAAQGSAPAGSSGM